MKVDYKSIGIGTCIGIGAAAFVANSPKLVQKVKEQIKSTKLNRSIKQKKKEIDVHYF